MAQGLTDEEVPDEEKEEEEEPSGAFSFRFAFSNWAGKKRSKAAKPSRSKEDARFSESLQPIHKFTLREIRHATNEFARRNRIAMVFDVIGGDYIDDYFDEYLIDEGCLEDYRSEVEYPIAVRRFETSKWSWGNVKNEKSILTGLKHDNIARLLGYCREKKDFMLIYEYSPNKNVNNFLFGREVKQRKLDWTGRYNLCLGIAKGLAHLHKKMKIIHQDIKTANIFLNNSSNPKITGFSRAKRARGGMIDLSSSIIVGTVGYLDPEFVDSGKLTEKVDVYSYGVVLLEVVRGKRCFLDDVTQSHKTMDAEDLLKFIDQRIGEAHRDKALMLLELSAMCTKSPSKERPEMTEVVGVLEGEINIKELNKEKLMQVSLSSHESQPKESSLTPSNAQSDLDGDGGICTMVRDPTNPDTEPNKLISSTMTLLEKVQQQMTSSAEELSHEEETIPPTDDEVHRVFEKLEILVRGNDLEKALGEEIKPEILRLCKILDGSTLSESRLHCVKSVKHLLESTSHLFSERRDYSLEVELYEHVKAIVELYERGKDVDASPLQITPLEKRLAAELPAKVAGEINRVNGELRWKMEDWKHLQESFRRLHNLNL